MKKLLDDFLTEFNELTGSLFLEKEVTLSVARLDKIHPVISGNKLFKLYYFLDEAIRQPGRPILTFGGAYSNHLAATAHACKLSGIPCIGIVRGERPANLSHTLIQCEKEGMHLHFTSRESYRQMDSVDFLNNLSGMYKNCIIIPEGGYHRLGAAGAALMMAKIKQQEATHICTAIGTATSFAGLLLSATTEKIIGIPVLKNLADMKERISYLTNKVEFENMQLFENYHFGGYAKKTDELIHFMNQLYEQNNVPTDFVYTAKMMYAIIDQIKAGYFEPGSKIICIHTGGLQGNDSLPSSMLVY